MMTALGLLGHASIPKVYAWGRSNFHEYLIMERLGDQNLKEYVDNGPPLTVGGLAKLVCNMVSTLLLI